MNFKERVRFWILGKLAPDIIFEQAQMRAAVWALLDLHLVKMPFNLNTWDLAFDNALAFAGQGQTKMQDRQLSLVTIFTNKLKEIGAEPCIIERVKEDNKLNEAIKYG